MQGANWLSSVVMIELIRSLDTRDGLDFEQFCLSYHPDEVYCTMAE
jgi:hypothetical protein